MHWDVQEGCFHVTHSHEHGCACDCDISIVNIHAPTPASMMASRRPRTDGIAVRIHSSGMRLLGQLKSVRLCEDASKMVRFHGIPFLGTA